MATATYSIQYTDAKGKKQTLKGVTDVKASEKNIKSQGGTEIVVVKSAKPTGNAAVPQDPNPDVADDDTTPVDDPTDDEPEVSDPAASSAAASAPASATQTNGATAPKAKGQIPAGLAKYLAAKKAGASK